MGCPSRPLREISSMLYLLAPGFGGEVVSFAVAP